MPLDHALGSIGTESPRRAERRRGDDTRSRLLDAVEALIADYGFKPLTHRTIASRAEAHVALLNYHFGSKEQLIEEALARRAGQLLAMQHDALAALRSKGDWTIEDVLWAYGRPFATLDRSEASPWRSYLCLVARLAGHDPSDSMMLRHFGSVYRECLSAFRHVLPGVDDAALAAGFRNCRLLLEHDTRARCGAAHDAPAHTPSAEELIAFLAGGMRGLAAQARDAPATKEATAH
ncbi:MAG TPA: TetR/AcrR family transcriptional regulator [Casimicrobiaceae bacterium]|jgi:AcrR family transcriptional regulator